VVGKVEKERKKEAGMDRERRIGEGEREELEDMEASRERKVEASRRSVKRVRGPE